MNTKQPNKELKLTKPSIMELRSLTPVFGRHNEAGVAEIAQIKTIPVTDDGGRGALRTHGIMVAVNTDQAGMDPAFVRQLANTIALHRMCSPPDTSVLVVSVIGAFDSGTFRDQWREALADSSPEMQALRYFLKQMTSAALAHGKRDGTLLESIDLRVD